jgi:hypothetical protein
MPPDIDRLTVPTLVRGLHVVVKPFNPQDDLGAGGSGNGAGGGEMEYDGREAGIGASAGMEGDTGRSG